MAKLNFEKSKHFIKFLILKYNWFYLEYAWYHRKKYLPLPVSVFLVLKEIVCPRKCIGLIV